MKINLYILSVFITTLVHAQFHQRVITTEQGLANDVVLELYQDSERDLWIGTDEGLSMYNGLQFHQIQAPEIKNSSVHAIAEFKKGIFFLATPEALYEYNKIKESITKSYPYVVHQIFQADSFLLLSTASRILKYQNGNFSEFFKAGKNTGPVIKASSGHYYFIADQYLYRKNKSGTKKQFHTGPVSEIKEGPDGKIWITTQSNGLFIYDPLSDYARHIHTGNSPLPHQDVRSIAFYRDKVYIGTNGGGYSQTDVSCENWLNYSYHPDHISGPSSTTVMDILVTTEGMLCMGTYGGGLNILSLQSPQFEVYQHIKGAKQSLISDNVRCITVDKQNQKWIGTRYGVSLINDKGIKSFIIEENAQNTILSLLPLSKDTLLIGTYNGGVVLYDLQNKNVIRPQGYRCPGKDIYKLLEFQGKVLVASLQGLFLTDFVSTDTLLKDIAIRDAFIENGEVFLGTNAGLLMWSESKVDTLAEVEGIFNIFKSGENILISSKKEGLLLVKQGKVKQISKAPIAAHSAFYSTYFWTGSNQGLVFWKDENADGIVLTEKDGLPSIQFNPSAAAIDCTGMAWMGLTKGLIRFAPAQMPMDTSMPQLVLSFEGSIIEDSIVVEEGARENLQIDAKTLFHRERAGVKIQWGSENEWVDIGNSFLIPLDTLPPGKHILNVKIYNSINEGSNSVSSVTIIVNKNNSFVYVALIALVIISFMIYWIFFRKRNKKMTIEEIFSEYLQEHYENRFEQQLLKIIIENIAQPELNVNFIAEKLSMSRSQLYRKIKESNQRPVNELIVETRLNLAKEMLQHTEMNISEIAYKTGFSSPSYFSKSFSSKFKKPPSSYQK